MPRALAAAKAARVRVLIRLRSFSANAANRCKTNGSTSDYHKGNTMHHQAADEMYVTTEPIEFGDCQGTFQLLRLRQGGSKLRPPLESTDCLFYKPGGCPLCADSDQNSAPH